MSAAPTWAAVALYANERIELVRTSLETAAPENIPALQAEVRVLRAILALPTELSPENNLEPDRAGY